MRLLVLSDLHLEWGDFEVPEVAADAVVLAGDIHTGVKGVRWAAERLPSVPIIYVLGNHEYYGHALPGLAEKLRAAASDASDRIVILDGAETELDGVLFLGATLWTDFDLFGDPQLAQGEAREWMNDYRKIRVSPEYRRLRPPDTLAMHRRELRWLTERLAQGVAGSCVVVTHHAPSLRSVRPDQSETPISACYASNLDELVEGSGAALWIHGHTHHAVDYRLGGTRVLSNPRGYAEEDEVPGFRPDLVVEV